MTTTNFTPKVKAAYRELVRNGEYFAARWLLHVLNTKHYIVRVSMPLSSDSAWRCAHIIDPDNSGYSFSIR